MSELLTTGEMIDRLKVGEIAGVLNKPFKQIDTQGAKVLYKSGILTWEKDELNFVVNDYTTELQWRILPNYVSFEEAMKALGNKKITKVELQHPKETYEFFIDSDQFYYRNIKRGDDRFYEADMNSNIGISGRLITHGKWTIEGDSDV